MKVIGKKDINRSALYWDITQRMLVVVYRRFGTVSWIPLPLKIGPIDCLEISVARNNALGAKTSYTPQQKHKISQVLIHFVNVDVDVKRGSEELSKMCSRSYLRFSQCNQVRPFH